MAKTLIYALHGFLGKAADWNLVADGVPEFEFICGEMFGREEFVWPELSKSEKKKVFLGYSLGGRLGLTALKHDPEAFDHYVFLSTNPGFAVSEVSERQQRLNSDCEWAKKVKSGNWDSFLTEWNAQSIFQTGLAEPVRSAADFDTLKLALALEMNSLGLQPDYRPIIRANKNRITWVVGSRDQKYLDIAAELEIPVTVVESGHRILMDNPGAVAEILRNIKGQLER